MLKSRKWGIPRGRKVKAERTNVFSLVLLHSGSQLRPEAELSIHHAGSHSPCIPSLTIMGRTGMTSRKSVLAKCAGL